MCNNIDKSSEDEKEENNNDSLIIDFDNNDEILSKQDKDDVLIIEFDEEEPDVIESGRIDLTGMDLVNEEGRKTSREAGFLSNRKISGISGKGSLSVQNISATSLFIMGAGGLAGGFIGWIFTELFTKILCIGHLPISIILEVGIYAAIIGGISGICLIISSLYKSGAPLSNTQNWLGYGFTFGAVGGIIGGGIAQAVYGSLIAGFTMGFFSQLLVRAIGWSIMGGFLGMGLASFQLTSKKMRNGIIGGALGGFIGGIAYQVITGGNESIIFIARMIVLSLMGLTIGLMIGLVEEAAKEVWLKVTDGPLSGKEFILYNERTTIGSSSQCDIYLLKDSEIAKEHAEIRNQQYRYSIHSLESTAQILVNDRLVTGQILNNGDTVIIGKTRMIFRERAREVGAIK